MNIVNDIFGNNPTSEEERFAALAEAINDPSATPGKPVKPPASSIVDPQAALHFDGPADQHPLYDLGKRSVMTQAAKDVREALGTGMNVSDADLQFAALGDTPEPAAETNTEPGMTAGEAMRQSELLGDFLLNLSSKRASAAQAQARQIIGPANRHANRAMTAGLSEAAERQRVNLPRGVDSRSMRSAFCGHPSIADLNYAAIGVCIGE